MLLVLLFPLFIIWDSDGNLLVEPSSSPESNVQRVRLISGTNDHNGRVGVDGQIVEARQQLRHNPVLHVLGSALAPLGDRLDLVDEQDTRRRGHCLLEQAPNVALRLAGNTCFLIFILVLLGFFFFSLCWTGLMF